MEIYNMYCVTLKTFSISTLYDVYVISRLSIVCHIQLNMCTNCTVLTTVTCILLACNLVSVLKQQTVL